MRLPFLYCLSFFFFFTLFIMGMCSKCSKPVSRQDVNSKIQCSECRKIFHSVCVDLKEDVVKFFKSSENTWRCIECQKAQRKSTSGDSTSEMADKLPTLSEVYNLLLAIKKEVDEIKGSNKKLEEDLGSSLDSVHVKLDENCNLIKNQTEELNKCKNTIEDLKNENLLLRKQFDKLKLQVDDVDQYSRRNTVEIQGIPVLPNEDVNSIVRKVGSALDINVSNDMIDVSHRLKKSPSQPEPGIVVRFVRRSDKDKFIARRKVKRNLSCKDLGLSVGGAIYVNHSLTLHRRIVFSEARKVKREKKLLSFGFTMQATLN